MKEKDEGVMGWGWKGAENGEDWLAWVHFDLDPMHSSKMVQKVVYEYGGHPRSWGNTLRGQLY